MAEKFDVQVFVEEGCETNQSILKLIESNQGLQTEILNHAQVFLCLKIFFVIISVRIFFD